MAHFDYRALAVLDAVVSTGSFELAASRMGIGVAAVAERIKALEDDAGRLLVVRAAPSLPTGLGQRLVHHYRNVMLMESALDIDLGRAQSMPQVAIAVDDASMATWFAHTLPALLATPRCQLDVQSAASGEALKLLREGALLGCVADAVDAPEGATATALGVMRHVCVATPAFAAHWFGDGFSIDAVQLAPSASTPSNLLARYLAREVGECGFARHTLPTPAAMFACVASGVAYGLVPELMALPLLASGQLVELKPGTQLAQALAWHAWKIDTPFTRALSEQVLGTARQYLLQA